jgi:hypothetical protein
LSHPGFICLPLVFNQLSSLISSETSSVNI